MATSPRISLIVPTRKRPAQLRAFLASVAETADRPEDVEVVLVIDADDPESQAVAEHRLRLKHIVVPPGLTMGALNQAGYGAAAGRYLMLLNDDVLARTPGWDSRVAACFRETPDDLLLVHVNDGIFRQALCTFPLVSRAYCDVAGGICPPAYRRYHIDDHIEDVFNRLGLLGERRTVYLPDVLFEHANYVHNEAGVRQYFAAPAVLAEDAATFDVLLPDRNALALRLKSHVERGATDARRLEAASDPAALRVPERLRVVPAAGDTRVTVAVFGSDDRRAEVDACLAAVRVHTRNYELRLLERPASSQVRLAADLNHVLSTTRTDHLAILDADAVVGPGWLDGLLGAMRGPVAVVSPMHRGKAADAWGGLAFHPDGSGHHGHLSNSTDGPRHALSDCGRCLLLDVAKCRSLFFDESYEGYFFDVEFGLKVWEAEFEVVNVGTVVRRLGAGPRPYGDGLHRDIFERDRERFAARWLRTGRLQALGDVWRRYPGLGELLDAGAALERVLFRGSDESLEAYRRRVGPDVERLLHVPIHRYALTQRVLAAPPGEHTTWLLKRCAGPQSGRRLPDVLGFVRAAGTKARKVRECVRQVGYRGLARIVWHKGRTALRATGPAVAPLPTAVARPAE